MTATDALNGILNADAGKRIAGFAMACIDTPFAQGGSVPIYEWLNNRDGDDGDEAALDHVGHVIAVYKAHSGVTISRPNHMANYSEWLKTFCDMIPSYEARPGDIMVFSDPRNVDYDQLGFRVCEKTICLQHGKRPCVQVWLSPYWENLALRAFRFKGMK